MGCFLKTGIIGAARKLRGAASYSVLAAFAISLTAPAADAVTLHGWVGGTAFFTDTATAGSPVYDDWANNANWILTPFPNTLNDSAQFLSSTNTHISFSQDITINELAGASGNYNLLLTNDTTVNPTGHTITLGGGGTLPGTLSETFELRAFATPGPTNTLQFTNSATAGTLAVLLDGAANSTSAVLAFHNNASAGTATITENSGEVDFHDSSTLAGALITAKNVVQFFDSSSAGTATGKLNLQSGGQLSFHNSSTGGAASLNLLTGSTTNFLDTSTAGSARLTVFGTANFTNNSTAGSSTIIAGALVAPGNFKGTVTFQGAANAGTATITTSGMNTQLVTFTTTAGVTTVNFSPNAGLTEFEGNSSAANATFATNGDGVVYFIGNSTAGSATFNTPARGNIIFDGSSSAGNGTFNMTGGRVEFLNGASGGAGVFNTSATSVVDFTHLTSGSSTTVGALNGTGQYSLGNNTITVGGSNLNSNFSGTLLGNGALIKAGTGTFTLTGFQGFSGSMTVNGGTLQFGDGVTDDVLSISTIADNAKVAFDLGTSTTLTAMVTGTGQLSVLGKGTLSVVFNNSYSGGTTITGATLQIADFGSIQGNVVDNGVFDIQRSDNFVFGGAISGTGSFAMTGTGTTELSGVNSFTGGTMVSSGTLQLGDAMNRAALAGPVTVSGNSLVDLENADISGLTNVDIAGGIFHINEAASVGTTTFKFDNAPSSSVLEFDSTSDAGHDTFTGANGVVQFASQSSAANANISTGVVTFTGTASAGSSTIDASQLSFFQNSTAGNAQITVSQGAFAQFENFSTAANANIHATDANVFFTDSSSAGNSTILLDSAVGGVVNGPNLAFAGSATAGAANITAINESIEFALNSNAGTATINVSGPDFNGKLSFLDVSSAANATIHLGNFTQLIFFNNSTAGNSTISGSIASISFEQFAMAFDATFDLDQSFVQFGSSANADLAVFNVTDSNIVFAGQTTANGATFNLVGTTAPMFGPSLDFQGTSEAGASTINVGTNQVLQFDDSASATQATMIVTGAGDVPVAISNVGGVFETDPTVSTAGNVLFFETSTAGGSSITLNKGALAEFYDLSDAGSATISANDGSVVLFTGNDAMSGATADAATIFLFSGSSLDFLNGASGGLATVIDSAGTNIDISGLLNGGTSLGSINGAGNVDLGANTLTLGGDNSDSEIGGAISDGGVGGGTGGSLVKIGTGTLTLDGSFFYTGTTTISAGTLVLGGGTNVLTGDIVDNGALVTKGSQLTLMGNISGSGSLTVTGGTTFLGGSNSFSGGTTVTGGTLSIAADNNLGTGGLVLEDGSTLQVTGSFNLDHAITVAGNTTFDIEGEAFITAPITDGATSGTLVKTGSGILEIAAADTFTGGTIIEGGSFALGAGGLSGSVIGTIVEENAGFLDDDSDFSHVTSLSLSNSNGDIFDGASTAAAAIILTNGSQLVFEDTSTAAHSPITVNTEGEVLFIDNATAGNAAITVTGRGFVGFGGNATAGQSTISLDASVATFSTTSTAGNAKFTATNNSAIEFLDSSDAGTAQFSLQSGADLTFVASSTADHAQIDVGNGSTLDFLENASGASAAVTLETGSFLNISDLTNGGTTLASVNGGGQIFLGADTLTIGGDNSNSVLSTLIQGSGGITKVGSGELDLNGILFYTGTTTITAGTVQIGGPVSLTGDIVDNAKLVTAFATLSLEGDISGNGEFDVISGTTFVTGTANSFSGNVFVKGGVLDVNGSLTDAAVVVAGGVLKGHGTVGTLTVGAAGIVAPGNSIGTIHVSGNVAFAAGSTYQAEVDPLGNSDLIDATGAASISSGATVTVSAALGRYAAQTHYTIIDAAGGVTGMFGGATVNLPFLTAQLVYLPTQVDLVLSIQDIDFAPLTTTPNEVATAAAVKGGGPASVVYGAMLEQTPNTSFVPQALDQLSGEIHPSVLSAEIDDRRFVRQTILNRLRQTTSGDLDGASIAAVHPAEMQMIGDHLAMWVSVFDDWGNNDSDGNAAGLAHALSGILAGADADIGNGTTLGVAGGYTRAHLDQRTSVATGGSGHIAGYGGWKDGPLALRVAAAYDWGSDSVARIVSFTGFNDSLTDRQDGHTTQLFGEAGYATVLGPIAAEPFAGLAYVDAGSGAFSEQGGAAALTGAGGSLAETYSSLGVRLAPEDDGDAARIVTPRASVSWEHAFGRLTPAEIVTFEATGETFQTLGVTLDRDAANIQLGLDVRVAPSGLLSFGYQGVQSGRAHDNALRAQFNWNF